MQATCANCRTEIFETNPLLSEMEGQIIWSHMEDNKCDDPEPIQMKENKEQSKMQTLSRGYNCSYCGNSAEDENGNFTVFAPDCKDKECIRADEPNHWHMTYAVISCNKCAKEQKKA